MTICMYKSLLNNVAVHSSRSKHKAFRKFQFFKLKCWRLYFRNCTPPYSEGDGFCKNPIHTTWLWWILWESDPHTVVVTESNVYKVVMMDSVRIRSWGWWILWNSEPHKLVGTNSDPHSGQDHRDWWRINTKCQSRLSPETQETQKTRS